MVAPAFVKTAWSAISSAAKTHAPALAGGMAIAAGAVALYKMAKAAIKAHDALEEAKADKQLAYEDAIDELDKEKQDLEDSDEDEAVIKEKTEAIDKKKAELSPKLTKIEAAKILAGAMWRPAIWAFVSALLVCASVYLGNRQLHGATTALAAASTMMHDRIAAEETVVGEKKAKAITDEIHGKRAVEAVTKGAMPFTETGKGTVEYVETVFTGRPFRSSQAAIESAINDLNRILVTGDTVTASDWLEALGLDGTTVCNNLEFRCDPDSPYHVQHDLLKVRFVAQQYTNEAGEQRPVLAVVLDNQPMYHGYVYRR